MIDLHSHTKYSQDSVELPENHLDKAIALGCKVFGFSEHLDYDYVVNNLKVVLTDVDTYYKNAVKLRDLYKGKIEVLIALEYAYDRAADDMYKDLNSKYNFDYIINSVHLTDGADCFLQEYFVNKDKQYAYDRYLKQVLQSIDARYDYEIVGHLGYASRNAPYPDPYLYYNEHKNIIDDILVRIIERQKTLEFNTNVRGAGSPYLPSKEIAKRYYQLGGRLVTFGSDAHQTERTCNNYPLVAKMLKDIGFKELVYFKNRKAIPHSL